MTQSLLFYALAELLFSLSPGPAVILVLSSSLRHGLTVGTASAVGVLSVNILYFGLSAIGVGAALIASPHLFLAVKYIGAGYLLWTAVQIMRESRDGPECSTVVDSAVGPESGNVWRRGFISGALTQASSFKNIMIFVAIIPQFIDPAGNVAVQFLSLCAVSVLVELPVLLGYVILASVVAKKVQNASTRFYLDGASAMMLVGIAGAILYASPVA